MFTLFYMTIKYKHRYWEILTTVAKLAFLAQILTTRQQQAWLFSSLTTSGFKESDQGISSRAIHHGRNMNLWGLAWVLRSTFSCSALINSDTLSDLSCGTWHLRRDRLLSLHLIGQSPWVWSNSTQLRISHKLTKVMRRLETIVEFFLTEKQ